jgi:hypothetical protein
VEGLSQAQSRFSPCEGVTSPKTSEGDLPSRR